jgi:hypothetical protein
MTEAKQEREIADSAEAQVLQEAIYTAVRAYSDYLDRHGLFYDVERELVRASALHVICDMCGDVDVILKDGAINRTRAPSKSRR